MSTDGMIIQVENLKENTKELIKQVNLARSQDTRLTCKNKLYFSILAMNKWKLKCNVPLTVASKTKYWSKLIQENMCKICMWGKKPCKTLLENAREDLNKWRDIDGLENSILFEGQISPNLIYKFTAITIKIQAGIFFFSSRQVGFKNIYMERERNEYSQNNFAKE